MINIQKYVRAKSLEEAYTLNQKKKNRILAGMLWTRMESGNVPVAIDLCDLGLDKMALLQKRSKILSVYNFAILLL